MRTHLLILLVQMAMPQAGPAAPSSQYVCKAWADWWLGQQHLIEQVHCSCPPTWVKGARMSNVHSTAGM